MINKIQLKKSKYLRLISQLYLLCFGFSSASIPCALGTPPKSEASNTNSPTPKYLSAPSNSPPSSPKFKVFPKVGRGSRIIVGEDQAQTPPSSCCKEDPFLLPNLPERENSQVSSSSQGQTTNSSFFTYGFPSFRLTEGWRSRGNSSTDSPVSDSPSSTLSHMFSNVQMTISQFRSFLNLLPTAVVVANRSGKITLVNEAASKFFGYTVYEMEGFPQARHLRTPTVQGLSITALMPPEIAQIHHFFISARMESGEHRIGKSPRDVVVKIRKDSSKTALAHETLSEEALQFSEEMQFKQLYTSTRFMTPTNPKFTQEEGFEFALAQMTLGEISLGGEDFYIGFFDNSVADRRKASMATRIAADAIGNTEALDYLLEGGANEDFAQEFQNVAIVFVDVVGSTVKIVGQPVQKVFADLNSLFSHFDNIVGQFPTATKIKTTGDGYIFTVGLDAGSQQSLSPRSSPSDFSIEASTAVAISRKLIEISKHHTLCENLVDIRVGIHFGPVMAGLLGTTKRVFDILGDSVSIAARMESTSQAGKIQISESTYKGLDSIDQKAFVRHENIKLRSSEYSAPVYLSIK